MIENLCQLICCVIVILIVVILWRQYVDSGKAGFMTAPGGCATCPYVAKSLDVKGV